MSTSPVSDGPVEEPIRETYPDGTVRALFDTEFVTPPTRQALQERLNFVPPPLQFFTETEAATLHAVNVCLMMERPGPTCAQLVAHIDARLAKGEGDGWRYDVLPPDPEAFRLALAGMEQEAQARFQTTFVASDDEQQATILRDVQWGNVTGKAWKQVVPQRFFEELLAELCQYTYSHPLAQEEIGYVGMADGTGWQRIGLNEREAREPEPQQTGGKRAAYVPLEPTKTASASVPDRVPLKPLEMRHYTTSETLDVVIIGTGAGGAPLLARLAQAGLKVVALEAGVYWNPEKDFATDEQAQLNLYWQDERLSAGENAVPFGNNNSGIGVGGSTLHYTAYTPRPHADDFRLHTTQGVGADWPLVYADLVPYYEEIENFLGVSGPENYLWEPERKAYPLPPLPLNGAAQLMQAACAHLNIRTSPAPNAALSRSYYQEGVGWRPACTNRGFCQAGCSVGAKASMDVTFIPLAIRAGAEVRTGCFVTQIETDAVGAVTGVVYQRDGRTERQPCRSLFLCAGAVESPRLLLLNHIGLDSGQVGRNFMAHPGMQVWGRFEAMTRPYKGIPGGLISEDTHRPADADFAGGYLLQSIGVMPVTYVTQLARAQGVWGQALRDHMTWYNHCAGINILGDCLPADGNYLELANETDARGLPKPRIHFSAGENEKRMIAHAEKLMRAIWTEAGGRDLWSINRFAHTIGTCRMGHDPAASVVNPEGRVHAVPNLYILDNSVFPSALSVNPALTIMALSLRTADRFLQTRKTGRETA